jgi:hypothetical protein
MPPPLANSHVLGLLPTLYDFRNHLNALVALSKQKFPDADADAARKVEWEKRIASQYSNRGDRPLLDLGWPLPFDLSQLRSLNTTLGRHWKALIRKKESLDPPHASTSAQLSSSSSSSSSSLPPPDAEVDGGHAITIEAAYLDFREQRRFLWSSPLQLPLPDAADVREEERDEDEKHIYDRLPPSRATNDDSLSLPPSSSPLPVTIPANGYQVILERLDALQTAFHSLQAAFDHHCIDHRVTLHRKRKRPADGSSEDGYATDRCYMMKWSQCMEYEE